MARETITIQEYPDDSIINQTIKEYEAFGWELVNNQRCQEYEGQTHGIDGSSTKHYSTFNKLTFSRDKSNYWYGSVAPMEAEYRNLQKKKPKRPKMPNKSLTTMCYIVGVVCIALGVLLAIMTKSPMSLMSAAGGLIPLTAAICSTVIGKKRKNSYRSKLDEWEENYGYRAEQLLKDAERIVNGLE